MLILSKIEKIKKALLFRKPLRNLNINSYFYDDSGENNGEGRPLRPGIKTKNGQVNAGAKATLGTIYLCRNKIPV